MKVKLTCQYCQKEFFCFPSQVQGNRRKYCSNECRQNNRSTVLKRIYEGKQPPQLRREPAVRKCKYCGQEFHPKYKKIRYCSIACANRGRHVGKTKKVPVYSRRRTDRWARVDVPCDYCGKVFELTQWEAKRVKHHFCRDNDKACYKAWLALNRIGKNHPAFGKKPSVRAGRGRGGFDPEIGHYVRSTWEKNIARWFKENGIEYIYEPQTFVFDEFSYTPDFYLPTLDLHAEVKGWWSDDDSQKVEQFLEHNHALWIIDETVYADLGFDPNETRYPQSKNALVE